MAKVPPRLGKALFRKTEICGEQLRLDWSLAEERMMPSRMKEPFADIDALSRERPRSFQHSRQRTLIPKEPCRFLKSCRGWRPRASATGGSFLQTVLEHV